MIGACQKRRTAMMAVIATILSGAQNANAAAYALQPVDGGPIPYRSTVIRATVPSSIPAAPLRVASLGSSVAPGSSSRSLGSASLASVPPSAPSLQGSSRVASIPSIQSASPAGALTGAVSMPSSGATSGVTADGMPMVPGSVVMTSNPQQNSTPVAASGGSKMSIGQIAMLAGAGLLAAGIAAGGGCAIPTLSTDMFSNPLGGTLQSRSIVTSKQNLFDQLTKHPTRAQLECRRNAPARPKHIVFAFSGLMSHGWAKAMLRGVVGNTKPEDFQFHYYPWDGSSSTFLTDSARCAFELATKPYRTPSGKIVYNTIMVTGHSAGGLGASNLAEMLDKMGVDVDLAVYNDTMVRNRPRNVRRCTAFYQRTAGISGHPVNGCENHLIGGCHLSVPMDPITKGHTQANLRAIGLCKSDFGARNPRVAATACHGAEAVEPSLERRIASEETSSPRTAVR